MGTNVGLEYSISLIQLKIQLDILVGGRGNGSLNNVIKEVVKERGDLAGCTYMQIKHWMAWGSRLADFCGAGELKSQIFCKV